MNAPTQALPTIGSTPFEPRSVHYNRRKFDNVFEIVARVEIDGVWRFAAIDIQPNRVKALEAVRDYREMGGSK